MTAGINVNSKKASEYIAKNFSKGINPPLSIFPLIILHINIVMVATLEITIEAIPIFKKTFISSSPFFFVWAILNKTGAL